MLLVQNIMSAPSRFIRLALGEHGVECDLSDEQPWQRRPEFIKVNPAATLPVLFAEADMPLCGHGPIMEYLDETRGVMMRDRRLMPEYPLERAEARRLVDWFMIKMDADIVRPLVRERIFKLEMPADAGGGAPNSQVMRAARVNIRKHLAYVNWLAGSRNWLGGGRMGYADLAGAAAISVLDYMGELDWQDVGHAREWYGRMKSRPSFRPILAERVRGLPPASHYPDPDF